MAAASKAFCIAATRRHRGSSQTHGAVGPVLVHELFNRIFVWIDEP